MFEWMDARAKTIPLEKDHWWRNLARAIVAKDGRPYRVLGEDLRRHVNRKKPFDHGMLSGFATNRLDPHTGEPERVTFEFAEALCSEYPTLPPPIFIPRSYAEATQLKKIADTFANEPAPDPNSGYIVTTHRKKRRVKQTQHATHDEATTKHRVAR